MKFLIVYLVAISFLLTACDKKAVDDLLGGGDGGSEEEVISPTLQNGAGGSGAAIDSKVTSSFALFQNDFVSRLTDFDGGATKQAGVNGLYSLGSFVDPNDGNKLKFFVTDRNNHRILIYNSVPSSASAVADVVVGQSDFTSGSANAGGAVSANGYNGLAHVAVCPNGKMFVADRTNHRVLGYNSVPKQSGVAADFVIGQTDMSSNSAGTSDKELNTPYMASCIGDRLLILDRGNNRILGFNTIPSADTPTADYTIGQANFTDSAGGCAANKLNIAYEMLLYNGKFYIADGGNHRVLVFNSLPTSSNASADAVLGQASLTSCDKNQDNSTNAIANGLHFPNGLAAQNGKLAISDHSNNRVLFYQLPAATNDSAIAALGQSDLTSNVVVDPPTSSSLRNTKALLFDGSHIWISDTFNQRLVVYPLPY